MFSDIGRDISSLPPDAQREVRDFVEFLKTKHRASKAAPRKTRRRKMAGEPFVGMWKDRPEMENAVEWVRRLRTGA